MHLKIQIGIIFFVLSACSINQSFQPPPHPASLWIRAGSGYSVALDEMRNCGWVELKRNINSEGKLDMNLYAKVDICMQKKGFIYNGKSLLLCQQATYKNLHACKDMPG